MIQLQHVSFSFFILTMIVGVGYMALGTGQAGAQEQPCTITIEKVADPSENIPFFFTITGDNIGEFTLRDPSDPSTFIGLGIDDTITITEDVTPGWTLESIECVEGDSSCGPVSCLNITEIENGIIVQCLDNDEATCVFTNVRSSNPIPTLSEWGLIAMAGVIGIAGFIVVMRRRKVTA